MTEHVISVEELDDGSWDATCECGWDATGYEEWEDAEAVGDEHVRNPEN